MTQFKAKLSIYYKIFILFIVIVQTIQDIYLHNPRGSNNRLNEKSATRKNNNRLFDSQNNARGGYNVGDASNLPFNTENEQYQMRYFQSGSEGSSYLDVEWTSQHGCGGDPLKDPYKVNCTLILQYMCQTKSDYNELNLDRIRDGINTNSQDFVKINNDNDVQETHQIRKNKSVQIDRGLHESWEWYDNCFYRERNKGLFTADQNLKNNEKGYSSAIFTRQNPNGQRNGYECAEERDYYPYWHPNAGWKDIAIITNDISMCNYYQKESFNVKSKYMCIEFYNDGKPKHWSKWNNEQDCVKNNGIWLELYNYLEKAKNYKDQKSCESNRNYKWAIPYDSKDMANKECLILLNEPMCQKADWIRSNHLGNGKDGKPLRYQWKLPNFPSKSLQKCVLRIRYNISSNDYDHFATDSKFNKEKSPIKNDPQVSIGSKNQALKLAIDTAQVGRVFQDRSHSFLLMARPDSIGNNVNIYNLNVKGKRGNIVQVYPAVEYDFVPNELTLNTNDLLHIQWTGSNTHNNGNPGGDGQTGDAGQGATGTDRNNFLQIANLNENYPIPFEISSIIKDTIVIGYVNGLNLDNDPNSYLKYSKNLDNSNKDLALYLSSSSYYQCLSVQTCEKNFNSSNLLDPDLNNSPASLPGVLIKFTKSNSIYYYMCSRNNNFSNRSQKGSIKIN